MFVVCFKVGSRYHSSERWSRLRRLVSYGMTTRRAVTWTNAMTPDNSTAALILIAEDHDDNRAIASDVLRHAGFRVMEVTRGDEVLRVAREHRPSLILMDIGMPGGDGLSATQQLKEDPATANIIILIVTGHTFSGDREIALKVGSDGYLTKPVSPQRLVRAVEHALLTVED